MLPMAALVLLGSACASPKPLPYPCKCAEQKYCKPLQTPPSECESNIIIILNSRLHLASVC